MKLKELGCQGLVKKKYVTGSEGTTEVVIEGEEARNGDEESNSIGRDNCTR